MRSLVKRISVILLSSIIGCMISGNIWAADAIPKAGNWQGSPSVSFLIAEKGKISDFKISVPLAMGECNINIPQIPITKTGEIVFDHPKKYFSIKGKFKTPTSIEGTATIKICPDPEDKNNTVMLVPWEKEWGADLK